MDDEVVSVISRSISQPTMFTKDLVPLIHFGLLRIEESKFTSGGFSRVYKSNYKSETVALKLLFVLELNKESVIKFYKEAQLLHDLRHDNIVTCVGVTLMPPVIGLVMEYCEFGSLFDFLYDEKGSSRISSLRHRNSSNFRSSMDKGITHRESRGSSMSGSLLPGKQATSNSSNYHERTPISSQAEMIGMLEFGMMLDAASALKHLHSCGFVHCDVKSLNYLVTTTLKLKLSDFGEVRIIDDAKASSKKPPRVAAVWCAPELLVPNAMADKYTTGSDIFSLTMVFSEILLKVLPLEDVNPYFDYPNWYAAIVDRGMRPILPDVIPGRLRVLMERAWHTDPIIRPSAVDLCDVLESIIKDIKINLEAHKDHFFSFDDKGVELRSSQAPEIDEESKDCSVSSQFIDKC